MNAVMTLAEPTSEPIKLSHLDGANWPDVQPGCTFGEWTVLGPGGDSRKVRCQCKCGTVRDVFRLSLRAGKSSNCYGPEHRRKHGYSSREIILPEYNAYHAMLRRCYSKSDKGFRHYGGRGIYVCQRWRDGFENFISDMGKKPCADYSLERKDVNGPYSPENCIWASIYEQANNRRNNKKIVFEGRETTLAVLAREYGIQYDTAFKRLKRGMSLVDALTQPLNPGKSGRRKC